MSKVLTLIPARAGSKGVPNKNIKRLGGKPLIVYTIDAALAAGLEPVVSTDSQEIADVARAHGAHVPGLRPASLATDTSTSLEVALHALDQWAPHAQTLCLLQPTSPGRTGEHITQGFALFEAHHDPVVGVTPVTKPPHWMRGLNAEGQLVPWMDTQALTRRQEAPELFAYNGALYILPVSVLRQTGSFAPTGTRALVMDARASMDIDSMWDWEVAQAVFDAQTGSVD